MENEPKKLTFKERWLQEDKVCDNCGQVTEKVRGITRQNLKRLITPKLDLNELIFTFIMIMLVVLTFSYKSETQQCRDWIGPMFEGTTQDCLSVCDLRCTMVKGIVNNSKWEPPKLIDAINFSILTNEPNETKPN